MDDLIVRIRFAAKYKSNQEFDRTIRCWFVGHRLSHTNDIECEYRVSRFDQDLEAHRPWVGDFATEFVRSIPGRIKIIGVSLADFRPDTILNILLPLYYDVYRALDSTEYLLKQYFPGVNVMHVPSDGGELVKPTTINFSEAANYFAGN